jgi:hypothetical protein
MTEPGTQDTLAAIGRDLDRACALLLSPSPANLDCCSGILESAVAGLDTVPTSDAQRFHGRVSKAAALLEHASQFHRSWRHILGAKCAGYQAGGQPAMLESPARLRVEG